MPKMTFFTQGRGGENLQFFQLSRKPFKMMKTTTSWPQDTWKVNICSSGWEIRENVKCPKMTILSQVRGHEKLQFFRLSGKSLKLMKTTTSTPGHLKGKYLPIWMRNMQVCEMPKMTFFTQGRGGENLQFFQLSRKPFKMMKTTTSWPQDTWKVNICSSGWEIRENVKCPKMTILSQVRGHEKLQFFRLSGKSLKLMKTTTSWPQDTWKVNICPFGWEICKFVKCPKWHFSRRAGVGKIFNFFNSPESLLKWWKQPPVDHRTLEK